MNTRLRSVALVAALGVLGACGSSAQRDAGGTVVDYLDAVGKQDYSAACSLLAKDAQAKVGTDCAKALHDRYLGLSAAARNDFNNISVRTATVNGSNATVRAADVRVERKTTRSVNGKAKTTIRYTNAQDITQGMGFTLTKSGSDWLITGGV